MGTKPDGELINIRPGVSILSVLRHLNYRPWFAIAEFVDNSLQSFLDYQDDLKNAEGEIFRLHVSIELNDSRLIIRDNAAGIHQADYARAFRPAAIPPDRSGLCEFGMGMKSAACWFAPKWTVRTSALGEPVEKTIFFDIQKIVQDDISELAVIPQKINPNFHFTEIILCDLHKPLYGKTIVKIKDHLSSIYRKFISKGLLELFFDNEQLIYEEPEILKAPYYKTPNATPQSWQKKIDLDFGNGLSANGFAALRETASVSRAGFALFRRERLIEGSADESYRPEYIFKKSNSYTYQRLFGELELEGFEISHTKDGFRWEENEEEFLELIKEELDKEDLPLIDQAEGYRVRQKNNDLREGAELATERTANVIEQEVPPIILKQIEREPESNNLPLNLPPAIVTASSRIIELEIRDEKWKIFLELTNDPAIADWLSIFDNPINSDNSIDSITRKLGVRLSLSHPFMERYGGIEASQIEPLLRLGVAIALAEVTARESGVNLAGTFRRSINELLRDALSKP